MKRRKILSVYTVAKYCSDISDLDSGIREINEYIIRCYDLNKKAVGYAYSRLHKLELKKEKLKNKNLKGVENMIKFSSYKTDTQNINWSELPDVLKRTHTELMPDAIAGEYKNDADVKRVVDSYIAKLNAVLANKPPIVHPSSDVIEPKQKTTTKPKESKKSEGEKVKLVERIDDEIELIKSYTNLHQKNKSRVQLTNFLNTIQKAILLRKVNKNSMYGNEIMEIQDSLIKALGHANVQVFDVVIDSKKLEHYKSIVSTVSPMLSVSLIKRYINLRAKATKEKVDRLLSSINRAIEKGYIDNNDKYWSSLEFAHEHLLNYSKGKNTSLPINEQGLTGLMGTFSKEMNEIINSEYSENNEHNYRAKVFHGEYRILKELHNRPVKWVATLESFNDAERMASVMNSMAKESRNYKRSKENLGFLPTMFAAAAGGAVQAFAHHHLSKRKKGLSGTPVPQVMTVNEVANQKHKLIGLRGDMLKLIGNACSPTSIMFYGKGGSGKSGKALQLASMLNQLGNSILYVAGEQFLTPTFTELINKVNISANDSFKIVGTLNALPIENFDVVVIDSKDSLGFDHSSKLEAFIKAYPNKIVILTSQGTKSGDYAGDGKWMNIVDVFVYCENGTASTLNEKNRWGGHAEIKSF